MAPQQSALSRGAGLWTTVVPIAALVALAALWGRDIGGVGLIVALALLGGAVIAAVHHAEVIAERVGEPYGSLVLAVAVTVIEVSLISRLSVLTVTRKRSFFSMVIGCAAIDSAAPVCRFELGHISSGMRMSRT